MKKIFKIISENSNAILIFITIIALVVIINTSLDSNRRASENLVQTVELYTKSINKELNQLELHNTLANFSGFYSGESGKSVAKLLSELDSGTEELPLEINQKFLNLIIYYQRIIEDRIEIFNTLFYFLITGIAIQFIFMIVTARKYILANIQLENSEEILSLLNSEREKERLRISSHLHDSVLQDIGSLLLKKEMQTCPESASELRRISEGLRDLTYTIAPIHLNSAGLSDSIAELVNDFEIQTGIKTTYTNTGFDESYIDSEVRLAFYRIAQESMNNINKHAKANEVIIKLVVSYPYLLLRIKDDGVGFASTNIINHSKRGKNLGMRLMNEQARSIGASVSGVSTPGAGTEITLKYRLQKGGINE